MIVDGIKEVIQPLWPFRTTRHDQEINQQAEVQLEMVIKLVCLCSCDSLVAYLCV